MLPALARRAIAGLAVIVGVVTLMFFLIRLAPGDPALLLVGPTATQEQLSTQRRVLGLDRPILQQYASWVGQFPGGNGATTTAPGQSWGAIIGEAWPATVKLVGLSLAL